MTDKEFKKIQRKLGVTVIVSISLSFLGVISKVFFSYWLGYTLVWFAAAGLFYFMYLTLKTERCLKKKND